MRELHQPRSGQRCRTLHEIRDIETSHRGVKLTVRSSWRVKLFVLACARNCPTALAVEITDQLFL